MDGSAAPSLVAPRLRLTRNSASMADRASPPFPQAGPSRHPSAPLVDLTNDHEKLDDEEDTQATPRIPASASLPPTHNSDNPAARLRALLARVPKTSNNNTSAAPPSSSERESDFEPPDSGSGTPSVARESLKELFSRVLQDPSDTPPKSRRRNSIDTSIIESSPKPPLSELLGGKGKHKRLSLSDEEVDRVSKYQQHSEDSVKSSAAATYDSLRAKLDRFRIASSSSRRRREDATSEASDGAGDTTEDTATLLRELHSPPAATSTPLHSMQMPSQIQMHSNLLEQDSEMQRAMNNSDSYEGDSGHGTRPPFPPQRHTTPASRPNSRLPHLKSPTHETSKKSGDPRMAARTPEPGRTPSRAKAAVPVTAADRERDWNRPQAKASSRPMSWAAGEHSHSHSHSHSSESSPRNGLKKKESTSSINQKRLSAGAELSRRGSSASLLSSDGAPNLGRRDSLASLQGSDGSSSRAPSALGLRSERPASATKEKAAEMERNWNKPRPRLSSANLRLHQSSSFQRSRTQSFPSRPDSAQSTQSIVSTQSSRSQVPSLKPRSQRRTSSITSSGRGSSIGSIDPDEEPEFEEVVLHERERNWNSPHPKWEISRRSISPAPPSRSTSPMPSPSPTHSRFSLNFRRRTESLGILKGTPPEEKTGGTASMKTPAKKPGLRTAASQSALSVSGHGPKSPSSPHLQAKAGSQSPSYLGLEPKRASHIPRPKSPMPSSQSRAKSNPELSNAGHRPTKLPTFKGAGFQFPSRSHSPLPPLELDEDSMDNSDHALNVNDENTRSDGEIDGSAEASHSPEESREPPAESNAARKRGHRRSLTEFSVAVGAIPPLPRVDSVAFPTDALRVPTDDVFTSDEESIPATSTPTIRVTPLPASDAPGASESNGERANDESGPPQRERGSLENPPATPPGTPPGTDEPYLSLVTPPRPQSFTPPRVETGAPSPTKDIPELPGPPSSSEEDTEDVQGYTPERPATIGNNINFSMMKTPKPPGAWAATPVPPRLPPSRAHSLPEAGEETETEQENGHATPVSSLSRAASLPTQTPAPPGAWMNTPGSRRKSILKVRFEVETSESEASHAGLGIGNGAPYGAPQFKLEDNSDESGLQHAREPAEHGPDGANALKSNEEQASEHPSFSLTPPSPQRTPRKGPSIRVLDAFGREAPNDEVAIKQEDDDEEVQVKEEATTSQRNRSSIRIVDAMGREILEEVESSADVSTLNGDSPLSQGQALARVRETIAELREGFIEAERSQNSLGIHDSRAEELQRVSRSARDARDKIFRSLQMVRSSDPELRSRLGPLKESMRNNRLLSGVLEDGRWRLPSPWTIACFITLQIVLIFIMYKVSVLRARRIFLTTYYDPFYPDLHLHLIKRDTLHHVSITTPTSWSIFSIPDGVQRVGWRGAFSEMWGNMTLGVTNLQQHVWRVWGAEDQPLSWPPT